VFQKELSGDIPNVTVSQVLQKHLYLPYINIWNAIVKLFFKHPALPLEVTLSYNYLVCFAIL
jgi:hypothetical protein